ncbi:hypothetical protein ACFX2I_000813 [Malus domestica]
MFVICLTSVVCSSKKIKIQTSQRRTNISSSFFLFLSTSHGKRNTESSKWQGKHSRNRGVPGEPHPVHYCTVASSDDHEPSTTAMATTKGWKSEWSFVSDPAEGWRDLKIAYLISSFAPDS